MCEEVYLWSYPNRRIPQLPTEALAARIVLPGSHQQSRPQSRKLSISVRSDGFAVSTAPP
jgi:hypothetical protein